MPDTSEFDHKEFAVTIFATAFILSPFIILSLMVWILR